MKSHSSYEVIIIGGSYAGLSAAMSLGRALRKVLVIDSGKPCNNQTPYSHNFLTQDGQNPAIISKIAREQVQHYETIEFYNGKAVSVKKTNDHYLIETGNGDFFKTRKLLLAFGLRDILLNIKGLKSCWGKSVVHCPYCHGYEIKQVPTAILANEDRAFHYAMLISNWTKDLRIFTNGPASFTTEQMDKITKRQIPIIEAEVSELVHKKGQVEKVLFLDGSDQQIEAIYYGPEFKLNSKIAQQVGCELAENGLIKVDQAQKTTVPGVCACGDISNMRALSIAVASGTMAGATINFELISEDF